MVEAIVSHFGKFDPYNKVQMLDIDKVPDFDLHEIAAQMMLEDPALACEATGSDNPSYKETMLPSLIRFMSRYPDRDEQIEFVRSWREGVAEYFKDSIAELLSDCLHRRNCEDLHTSRPTQSKESFGIHY